MDMQVMKGRAIAALTAALVLLVIVIFLARAGKTPVLLAFLMIFFAVYGFRTLWTIKNTPPKNEPPKTP